MLGNPLSFIDPFGLYRCVNGAVCDFTPEMDTALTCFELCVKRYGVEEVAVTSGRDSHDSDAPHMRGEAVDIGRNTNRKLKRPDAERCFCECFPLPNRYGQEEENGDPPGGTHYHIQRKRGTKGGTNFWPGIVPKGKRKR